MDTRDQRHAMALSTRTGALRCMSRHALPAGRQRDSADGRSQQTQTVGDRLLLSPREPLLAGRRGGGVRKPAAAAGSQRSSKSRRRSGRRDRDRQRRHPGARSRPHERAARGRVAAPGGGAAGRQARSSSCRTSRRSSSRTTRSTRRALRRMPWRQIWIGHRRRRCCAPAMVYAGLRWPNELAGFRRAPPTTFCPARSRAAPLRASAAPVSRAR